MEITNMLTISTAHIAESTANFLEELVNNKHSDRFDVPMVMQHTYGFIIWVGQDDITPKEYGISEDLRACMQLAYNNACHWLNLDSDAEIVPDLETFDW